MQNHQNFRNVPELQANFGVFRQFDRSWSNLIIFLGGTSKLFPELLKKLELFSELLEIYINTGNPGIFLKIKWQRWVSDTLVQLTNKIPSKIRRQMFTHFSENSSFVNGNSARTTGSYGIVLQHGRLRFRRPARQRQRRRPIIPGEPEIIGFGTTPGLELVHCAPG